MFVNTEIRDNYFQRLISEDNSNYDRTVDLLIAMRKIEEEENRDFLMEGLTQYLILKNVGDDLRNNILNALAKRDFFKCISKT